MHVEVDMNPRQVATAILSFNTYAHGAFCCKNTNAQDVDNEMTDNRNNQHIFLCSVLQPSKKIHI